MSEELNIEIPKAKKGYSLYEHVAQKASRTVWGNNFIWSSEDEAIKEAIEKIMEWNPLLSLFFQMEKVASLLGLVIVELVRTETGRVGFNIAQPWSISRVARVINTPQLAVTWSRFTYDDTFNYIRTTYRPNETVINFVNSTRVDEDVTVAGEQQKIAKELQIKMVDKHNLGKLPIAFVQNLPHKNFFNGEVGEYYPDSYAIRGLQEIFEKGYESIEHELDFNRTRIVGRRSQNEIQNSLLGKPNSITDIEYDDFWIEAETSIPGTASNTLIIQGDPKLSEYLSFLQGIKKQFIEGCNYSADDEITSQKTEAEVLMTKSNEAETTRVKMNFRQTQIKPLLTTALEMLMGRKIEDDAHVFEIKENIIVDRLKQVDIAIKLIDGGLSTPVREIKKLNGVSTPESEKIWEDIKTFRKEEDQRDLDLSREMNDMDMDMGNDEKKEENNNKDKE